MTPAARPVPAFEIPHVWLGRELAQAQETTVPTGHAALDAHLPGKGWPLGCLVEVLQAQSQQHVWALLGPGLSAALASGDPAVLVHPPYQPFGPCLRALGIAPERLLLVQSQQPSGRLWAAEQALRCADVSAVLAWIPQARTEELRRLHLCAQAGQKLLVLFRPESVRNHSSPARLRLLVQGTEALEVQILKRRGPPLLEPLLLRAQPQLLASLLAARQQRRTVTAPATKASHVLDRPATHPA
jgi:protein ImuA